MKLRRQLEDILLEALKYLGLRWEGTEESNSDHDVRREKLVWLEPISDSRHRKIIQIFQNICQKWLKGPLITQLLFIHVLCLIVVKHTKERMDLLFIRPMLVSNVLSPMATSARALFGGNNASDNNSTQGNSAGEVNSPKVVSAGSLLCGVCDEPFANNEEVTTYMNMDYEDKDEAQVGLTHDNAPNELTNDTSNNSLNVQNVERESI